MAKRPVVLAWPARVSNNPFPRRFCEALESAEMDLAEFDLRSALRSEYDILLVHWPERVVERRYYLDSLLRVCALALILCRCRLRSTPVVWLAHNLVSHEHRRPGLEKGLHLLFDSSVSGIIHLSSHSLEAVRTHRPRTHAARTLVVRHGQDVAYSQQGTRPNEAGTVGYRFAALGAIKRYKNLPSLARTMSGRLRVTFEVAGAPFDESAVEDLRRIASSAPNVLLDLRFLSDTEFDERLWANDALVVANSDFLNSGTVLHGLSRGIPVIAPDTPVLREVQEDVGADWLLLYAPPFTEAGLDHAVRWLDTRRPVEAAPDMRSYAWTTVGSQVATFLRNLLPQG